MHFEILVEDHSGKLALDSLVPRILGPDHTYSIHSYRGIGRIPKGLKGVADPSARILLDQLPRLLRGFGRTFAAYPPELPAAVIVVCDLDDRCLKEFRRQLLELLERCQPRPKTRFCIAIEECESWFLGDPSAVLAAFPKAKRDVLDRYYPDSICGTWELLADVVYPSGATALKKQGWQAVGEEKARWAEAIAPRIDIDGNASPSFRYLRDKLRALSASGVSTIGNASPPA